MKLKPSTAEGSVPSSGRGADAAAAADDADADDADDADAAAAAAEEVAAQQLPHTPSLHWTWLQEHQDPRLGEESPLHSEGSCKS